MEYSKIITKTKIVIVYFFSNECYKCNIIFKNLKEKYKNKNNVSFFEYDIENIENEKLLDEINLKSYPFFYIYKNGVLIDSILGSLDVKKILDLYSNI